MPDHSLDTNRPGASKLTVRRVLAAMAGGAVLIGTGIGYAAHAVGWAGWMRRCSPMSKRLVKVQEFDRSTLLDIWLDGFTSGLTTAAKNLTGCSGEMAAEFADEIARGIMNDPAAMEMVRREVRERVTGMFDPNADTRELGIDTAGGAR